MKKLLLLFCLFTTSWTFAQNNLQFSRVVNLKIAGSNQATGTGVTQKLINYKDSSFVVPTGKVWKIESANVTAYGGVTGYLLANPSTFSLAGWYLIVDNFLVASQTSKISTTNKIDEFKNFPFWLSAGTYSVKLIGQAIDDYSYTIYANISAIEFSVQP